MKIFYSASMLPYPAPLLNPIDTRHNTKRIIKMVFRVYFKIHINKKTTKKIAKMCHFSNFCNSTKIAAIPIQKSAARKASHRSFGQPQSTTREDQR